MSPKLRRWISVAFFICLLGLVFLIHKVLLPFVISGIFVYLLAPVVEALTTKKILGVRLSRAVAVMFVYMTLGLTACLLGLIVLPPLYQEVLKIASDIPAQLEHLRTSTLPWLINQVEIFNNRYGLNVDVQTYFEQTADSLLAAGQGQVEGIPAYIQKLVKMLFSALSSFLVMFIVTAFVLIDLPRIKLGFYRLVPSKHRQTALELVHAIDRDLSGTIRGQLMICLINGTLTTLALLMLKVKFAITIGFVAGIFSLIPVFGAIISTIPAVLIALTQSLWTALAVIGVIIIIHLIEANVLNPKVLGHTVELHPAIIVFAIMVGEHFFGAIGLLFGVPVAAILRSILRYVYLRWFAEDDMPVELPPLSNPDHSVIKEMHP